MPWAYGHHRGGSPLETSSMGQNGEPHCAAPALARGVSSCIAWTHIYFNGSHASLHGLDVASHSHNS